MKTIGIYSGSFNPIHVGHVRLADYICSSGIVDEVWLMVSPLNPLKQGEPMESDSHRLAMAEIAIDGNPHVRVSDFEFNLPRPNYTYNTLLQLHRSYPDLKFVLIIGSDNWQIITKWRNWEEIISEFGLVIYPRPGYEIDTTHLPDNVKYIASAPLTDISSTQIRNMIAALHNPIPQSQSNPDTEAMLHSGVLSYIENNSLYK